MIFFEFSTVLVKNSIDIAKIPEILLNFAIDNQSARRSSRELGKGRALIGLIENLKFTEIRDV